MQMIASGNANINVTLCLKDLETWGRELVSQAIREAQSGDDKYLTPSEVASMLQVDRSTLWRWEKENYLVPIRIGRKPRYLKSDIENMVKV